MKKRCVGMLLAGGEGKRLGLLTKNIAKPAVPFGGKYRIIDFTLSNCTNSGIDTVGVLTQYEPLTLNAHLGIGSPWDLDRRDGGVSILPPFMAKKGASWYQGTADAIYQNISFIEQYNPDFVLVISGDHIYKMNYSAMIDFHTKHNAEATISVIQVPWEEASRFGIMNTGKHHRITEFEEKPENPKNNMASMGIYIFNWSILKSYLLEDAKNIHSSHDFGKDIIPAMLDDNRNMVAFPFNGYWKDVGTVRSYWEANMDLLKDSPSLQLNDVHWRIFSVNPNQPPQFISPTAKVSCSLINEGCIIHGTVANSILFYGVEIKEQTTIKHSVIMSNVSIGKNVVIERAIINEGTVIPNNVCIKPTDPNDIIVLDKDSIIADYAIAN
ncbi:glucose-1-phosphate adenylyltransferase [Alkalihalobacillus sp. LMS39]|uniref:glucose-1-phosphate adenylyltransferase n=1 Tax=Alkalihalobacillus sp. LMS39 TaxID=2924032 RepID=UPI001FB310AF|nr:glucose-1-phosphate adenylyltransferase [Alkalihalobacillus sp. LMS39]UOE95395.1 glucose-1-phosphate adenylyltransferase [Alkalihalobacillus sp. LMS39]